MKRIILFSLLLLFSTFSFGQEKEFTFNNMETYSKIIGLLKEKKDIDAFKLCDSLKGSTKESVIKELEILIKSDWVKENEKEFFIICIGMLADEINFKTKTFEKVRFSSNTVVRIIANSWLHIDYFKNAEFDKVIESCSYMIKNEGITKALLSNSIFYGILKVRGQSYYELGQYELAIQDLENYLYYDDKNQEIYGYLIDINIELDNLEKALVYQLKLCEIEGYTKPGQRLVYQLCTGTENYKQFPILKREILKADSIDFSTLHKIISDEAINGIAIQENLQSIIKLIDRYPNELKLYETRGCLYSANKDYNNANKDFTKCYKTKRLEPESMLDFAFVKFTLKDFNQAERILDSIPNKKRNLLYYTRKGLIYFELGEYEKTHKILDSAFFFNNKRKAIYPSESDYLEFESIIYHIKSSVFNKQGKYKEAFDAINKSQSLTNDVEKLQEIEAQKKNIAQEIKSDEERKANPEKPYITINWADPDINDLPSKSLTTKENNYEITAKAHSNKMLKATDFQVFINNKPYDIGSKLGNEKLKINRHIYHFTKNIVLEEGSNKIKVKVKNEVGEVTTEEFKFEYKAPKTKPILHVFAIGTKPQDLNYTAKDAQDIASVFERNSQNLYDMFSGVKIRSLIGENATSQNIATTLERLAINFEQKIYDSNEDISPNDVVVLFVSAHGFIGSNNEFRIQGQDFDVNTPTRTSVAYEELQGYLERIKCKKIVLIDACKSGGAKGDNSLSEALARLNSKQKGTTIISSCQAHELSFEHQAWENGAFTEAIIEAFQGKCDSNNNKLISVVELFTYVEKRVMELVHSVNKPTQRPSINRNEIGNDVEFFKIK